MALTGMQIYKNLPKTNCKDCGFPTCMAFAMQVAAKKKALEVCPHVSDVSKAELGSASEPPMKLVKIGVGDNAFETGQETVMFRHEEKFHRGTGIAVRIPASLSDEDAAAKIETINKATFERVGETIKVAFTAVDVDCDDPAGRAKLAADKSKVPLILMGKDTGKLKAALEAVKDKKPLVYKAAASNIDDLADAAAAAKAPLAVSGATLDELADNTQKATAKGAVDIVLAFEGADLGETIRNLTKARRAALKKAFRALGYPSMVNVTADSLEMETVLASSYAAKYAGIVIISTAEAWQVLPIMTTVQNVYTDPQKPNTVEAKLYEIGSPNENSPVLYTTNFSLTYFSVAGEVERSKVASYICVVDTEGLGVLNAYAGDKISSEKVIKALKDQGVANKVKHRKLIIPGLLPIFRAQIEEDSEWKEVIIGPETASKIPAFLSKNWK